MNNTNSNKGNTMKRITIFGAIVLATIGTAIAGATPASATNTTTPDTTIVNAPDTTVPDTTEPPATTEPCTAGVPNANDECEPVGTPDTTTPYTPRDVCLIDGPNGYTGDTLNVDWMLMDGRDPARVGTHDITGMACGPSPTTPPPVDSCVGINPATGEGTTLLHAGPCAVAVATPPTPPATAPQLPATGTATNVIAVLAGLFVGAGAVAWRASRRDGDRMIERLDRTDGAS